MIRFFLGLLLVAGGVGHIDIDPTDQALIEGLGTSVVGLVLMHFGVNRIREQAMQQR